VRNTNEHKLSTNISLTLLKLNIIHIFKYSHYRYVLKIILSSFWDFLINSCVLKNSSLISSF